MSKLEIDNATIEYNLQLEEKTDIDDRDFADNDILGAKIADRLKVLKERRDLSIGQMAHMCDVDESTITRLLGGTRKCHSPAMLKKLSDGLNTNVAYLLGDTNYMGPISRLPGLRLSPRHTITFMPHPDDKEENTDEPCCISRRWVRHTLLEFPMPIYYKILQGDAMSPKYKTGDLILYVQERKLPKDSQMNEKSNAHTNTKHRETLLSRAEEMREYYKVIARKTIIRTGDIIVAIYRGKTIVRVFYETNNGGATLEAINKDYPTITVTKDELNHTGTWAPLTSDPKPGFAFESTDDKQFKILGKVICVIPAPKKEMGLI